MKYNSGEFWRLNVSTGIVNFQLTAKQHSVHEYTRGTSTVTDSVLSGTENKAVEVFNSIASQHLTAKF
jgi:hypothetical protein